jgi:acetolactate synthase-1/2/3 large subunit
MSNEPKHNEPTGADIVVKTLEQQGVKWIFGIPGAKIDKVFDTPPHGPSATRKIAR